MQLPELETARLRLRNQREADVDALFRFYSDPVSQEIYRAKFTRADVWRRFAVNIGHIELRGFGGWAVEEKSTGQFAGFASLWFPEGWDDIEVGYGILPENRRKGYAAEAAACARDFGYRELGFKKLVSYIQPTNLASIGVAEKLGAKPDGEFDMFGIAHTIYVHINTDQKE